MEKAWLTDELDQKPYVCNRAELQDLINSIEVKKGMIDHYFDVHPKAKEKICNADHRQDRFVRSAISYLELEGAQGIDIVPSKYKTQFEKEKELEDIKKLGSYQEACEYVHNEAVSDGGYLSPEMLIRAHTMMYNNDPDKRSIVRYRFRNEEDNEIMVGQGYFAPVPGELVSPRVNYLFFNYANAWWNDHVIIKSAKFVTEYIRIQPHMDGNKRTSLMALNFILEKNGYPDIYFDKSQQTKFFNAIKKGMIERDVTDLARMIGENTLRRCDSRIEHIRDFRIRSLGDEMKRHSALAKMVSEDECNQPGEDK